MSNLRSWLAFTALAAVVATGLGCDDCRVRFVDTLVPQGQVGVPYFAVLDTSCSDVDEIVMLNGTLPPGINLSGLGGRAELQGTPLQAGDFDFMIEAVRYGEIDPWTNEPSGMSRAVANIRLTILEAPGPGDGPPLGVNPGPGGGDTSPDSEGVEGDAAE